MWTPLKKPNMENALNGPLLIIKEIQEYVDFSNVSSERLDYERMRTTQRRSDQQKHC